MLVRTPLLHGREANLKHKDAATRPFSPRPTKGWRPVRWSGGGEPGPVVVVDSVAVTVGRWTN